MSILDLKDINVCIKDIKSISIDVDDDNNLSCLYIEHIKDIDAHNNIAREIGNIPMCEFSIKKLHGLDVMGVRISDFHTSLSKALERRSIDTRTEELIKCAIETKHPRIDTQVEIGGIKLSPKESKYRSIMHVIVHLKDKNSLRPQPDIRVHCELFADPVNADTFKEYVTHHGYLTRQ